LLITKSDETLLTENKNIAREFKVMFKELLNQPSVIITVKKYVTVEQLLEKSLKRRNRNWIK